MRAQEISQAIYEAECELRHEISTIVETKLKDLSEKTGMNVDSLGITLIESTVLSSVAKEWKVSRVEIYTSMPPAIAMDWP